MSRPQSLYRTRPLPAIVIALAAALLLVAPIRDAAARGGAETLLVTSNLTIGDGDLTYEGYHVIVRGATLTINGAHSFASLTVERNELNQPGVVTHAIGFFNRSLAGTWLTITGNCTIEGADGELVASRIDVNGRGFAAVNGPGAGTSATSGGGAGHGGIGARSVNGTAGGGAYGSVLEPSEMGSGGGNDVNAPGQTGGRGGGVIRLSVGGTLTLDGSIEATGTSGTTAQAGGGAGGSIWIDCGGLTGTGSIIAHGGNGAGTSGDYGGGGAGGRIAVYASTSSFASEQLGAHGGRSGSDPVRPWGAAGTVYFDDASATRALLLIDNGGNGETGSEYTPLFGDNGFDADLIVRGFGRFGPAIGDATMAVSFTGDATVAAAGIVTATGRGFAAATGPGAGTSATSGGGAGHGGIGARSVNGTAGGVAYGSVLEPSEMGSGGGNDTNVSGQSGGRGGGVIRLSVGGTLTLDGSIEANAFSTTAAQAGGGSGGSIWIDCGELIGTGSIIAHGGNGAGTSGDHGGGGAGGRIAVYASMSSFTPEQFGAFGGRSGSDPDRAWGAAGTVYVADASAPRALLLIDNGGNGEAGSEYTPLFGVNEFDADLVVRGFGRFGPAIGDASMAVSVTGDATIAADGLVTATGRGFAAASGPGGGVSATKAGGGGHGGIGANSISSASGGVAYGSVLEPIEMGSGGGNDTNVPGQSGGRGGGVIRLSVGGTLTLDGSIEANAFSTTAAQAGGGSGGSIWIDCGGLTGTGSITAHGGNGAGTSGDYGGGGAGGRIAVYASTSSFASEQLGAHGGRSGSDPVRPWGAAGTVYFDDASATRALLLIDNGGNGEAGSEYTPLFGANEFNADLLVRGFGRFGPAIGDATMAVSFAGDATIAADGLVTATARGFAAAAGPGAGASATTAGGAGHGGPGAPSVGNAAGGAVYGSFDAPSAMGSGGGNDTNVGGQSGGRGGGVIRLSVGGILTLDGSIEANGFPGTTAQAGGGSGGSIWIDCGSLFGRGVISADGGAGAGTATNYGGGGGGGRIAIYCCAVDLPEGNIRAAGGQSGQSANFGSDGTIGFFSDTIDFAVPPVSTVVETGTTVELFVVASGDGITAYQWFYQGIALVDGDGIDGAQTDTLTLSDVTCETSNGAYRVRVTDACGDAFSPDAFLTVAIFGDLNGDCVVDGADLGVLLNAWGPCDGCPADLNGDGVVDGADLGLLLNAWGG